jgi:hypothetical protein
MRTVRATRGKGIFQKEKKNLFFLKKKKQKDFGSFG